jgi:hypothetical protein
MKNNPAAVLRKEHLNNQKKRYGGIIESTEK